MRFDMRREEARGLNFAFGVVILSFCISNRGGRTGERKKEKKRANANEEEARGRMRGEINI